MFPPGSAFADAPVASVRRSTIPPPASTAAPRWLTARCLLRWPVCSAASVGPNLAPTSRSTYTPDQHFAPRFVRICLGLARLEALPLRCDALIQWPLLLYDGSFLAAWLGGNHIHSFGKLGLTSKPCALPAPVLVTARLNSRSLIPVLPQSPSPAEAFGFGDIF